MKRRHLFTAGAVCHALLFNVHAQTLPFANRLLPEKPALFSMLPEKLDVSKIWIEKLFAGPDTGRIKIQLTADKYFEGMILQKAVVNSHVTSINIKSSNYDGAMLSISRVAVPDSSVKYIGRIISIRYSDVLVLTQDTNNKLSFSRRKQSSVVTE